MSEPAPTLFRVAVREKETDKRKNATCHEYVVLATDLEDAKALAVAEFTRYDDGPRMEKIAAVGGHQMRRIYQSDIYGSRKRDNLPETLPSSDAIARARAVLQEDYAREQEEEGQDDHPEELTK